MTLRTRLLLALVGVVAVGLAVTDVVVTVSLRSFLVSQVDPQLRAVVLPVSRALLVENGHTVPPALAGSPGTRPATAAGGLPAGPGPAELVPAGTFAELVRPDGRVVGRTTFITLDGARAPSPQLPRSLEPGTVRDPEIFTATSGGSNPVTYRVAAVGIPGERLTSVVAVPLTGVDQTIGELVLIEVLVSVAVMIGLAVIGWRLVRRDLRPLEDMARTAGEISRGDLTRRVSPSGGASEVGRLGLALNVMLGEIEGAFADRSASEQRMREFLANASHELRTPLTSIRGYAELFDRGARERPADLETAMRHISGEADRMNLLVDDLLLLARLGRGRSSALVPTDLVEVVGQSVSAARARAPGRPIVWRAPERLVAVCDGERVRQVVDNYLSNALRYAPGPAPVEVELTERDGAGRLVVADRGPGIAPEDAERIFEPFYRADSSRARESGGAGLGLAIVASTAAAQGGSVGVEGRPGGGSRFWYEIPLVPLLPS